MYVIEHIRSKINYPVSDLNNFIIRKLLFFTFQVAEVLSYVPGSLPADYLLGLYDLESPEGRELCAKAICATLST